jgi:hypothetical protein
VIRWRKGRRQAERCGVEEGRGTGIVVDGTRGRGRGVCEGVDGV